jgi:hypothetical protein
VRARPGATRRPAPPPARGAGGRTGKFADRWILYDRRRRGKPFRPKRAGFRIRRNGGRGGKLADGWERFERLPARRRGAPSGLALLAHLPQNCWGRLGGGCPRSGSEDWARDGGCPPPQPSPANCAGRVTRPTGFPERDRILPSPEERGERGPPVGAVRPSSPSRDPSATPTSPSSFGGGGEPKRAGGGARRSRPTPPQRDRILPSPRGTSGEGPEEGPPPAPLREERAGRGRRRAPHRRQIDALSSSLHPLPYPNLPQQFWGRWRA